MQREPFDLVETATVNGAGVATVRFQPSVGYWDVTAITCETTSNTLESTFRATIDGKFKSGSFSGSMDTDSSFNQRVNAQSTLQGQWTGGDVGAIATMTITGWKVTP